MPIARKRQLGSANRSRDPRSSSTAAGSSGQDVQKELALKVLDLLKIMKLHLLLEAEMCVCMRVQDARLCILIQYDKV